jgi:SAM-dependent methyltransferase
MHVKKHKKCRICGNTNLTEVLDLGLQHIQGAFEHPESLKPPYRKVQNKIVRCNTDKYEEGCGLIQSEFSISPEILYRNYWYQSGISQTMTKHLHNIAKEAINILNTSNSLDVLDIAANDGTLLRGYPDFFNRVGIDPSNIALKQKDVKIINEVYPNKQLKNQKFDVITSIACFYDVNEPQEFVNQVKNNLKESGIWIAEFAYWPLMLENLAFDQVLLEHSCHYYLFPFEQLLKQSGLKLFRAEKTNTNGGSIMIYACNEDCDLYENQEWKNNLSTLRFEEFEKELDENKTYENFRNQVKKYLLNLKNLLLEYKQNNKIVHLYAASTKMNVVLEAAEIDSDLIPYAAERSSEKWGAKTLSGIKIISEEDSRKMKPDAYICSLIGFKKEIIEREKEYLNNGGEIIFLPTFEVIKTSI